MDIHDRRDYGNQHHLINTHMDQRRFQPAQEIRSACHAGSGSGEQLVGIITIDDIIDIIELENTEDFHVMAAMEPSRRIPETSVARLARNRIVWLLI